MLNADLPELVVLKTYQKPIGGLDVLYLTECLPSWGKIPETTLHVMQTLLLFCLPLCFMTVAYVQIVKVLWSWSNIPGHAETKNSYYGNNCNGSSHGTVALPRAYHILNIGILKEYLKVVCSSKLFFCLELYAIFVLPQIPI